MRHSPGWDGYVREQAHRFTYALLRPCVMLGDTDAIQRALQLSDRFRTVHSGDDSTRVRVLEVMLNLTADALAADARVGAFQLVRWLGETISDGDADLVAAANRTFGEATHVAPPSLLRQSYVTVDDLRMALVLPAALVFELSSKALRRVVRSSIEAVGSQGVEQEIERLGQANHLPAALRDGWAARLTALTSWIERDDSAN